MLCQWREAERQNREGQRGPAQRARNWSQEREYRQCNQQRKADAVQDVDADQPARLAEDGEPGPVHQRGDDEHLAEASQRALEAAAARAAPGCGAHLRERHRESGGEDERGRDESVDPLQAREEVSGAQFRFQQRQRVSLDHHQHREAAQPVEGADPLRDHFQTRRSSMRGAFAATVPMLTSPRTLTVSRKALASCPVSTDAPGCNSTT